MKIEFLTSTDTENLLKGIKDESGAKSNGEGVAICERVYKETEVEAINNAYDILIIFTEIIRKGSPGKIIYHFHFLLTEIYGSPHAFCLDTNILIPLSEQNPSKNEIEYFSRETLRSFCDRASTVDKDVQWISKRLYFSRASQSLWDKFNDIKEGKFVSYALEAIDNEDIDDAVFVKEEDVNLRND